jgi:uncharacterized lipoprotein YbaY
MKKLWELEPALVVGVVVALMSMLVSVGVPITAEQHTAAVGLVTATLALAGGVVVRQRVTPVAKLQDKAPALPLKPVLKYGKRDK